MRKELILSMILYHTIVYYSESKSFALSDDDFFFRLFSLLKRVQRVESDFKMLVVIFIQ